VAGRGKIQSLSPFRLRCTHKSIHNAKYRQIPLNPPINWGTLRIFCPPFEGGLGGSKGCGATLQDLCVHCSQYIGGIKGGNLICVYTVECVTRTAASNQPFPYSLRIRNYLNCRLWDRKRTFFLTNLSEYFHLYNAGEFAAANAKPPQHSIN
jgi:hypothetical protein